MRNPVRRGRGGWMYIGLLLTALTASGCKPNDGPPPEGKSVIMVVIEALPAKVLGCYGNRDNLTPSIDAVAKSGILFERFHSAGPWTMPSFGTILTGLPPALHRAGRFIPHPVDYIAPTNMFFGLRENVSLLPKLLPGVQTGAIINNVFLHPDFGFSKDWGTYDYQEAGFEKYRDGATVTNLALDWLKKYKDRPKFLLVHYFDPHLPYVAPKSYEDRLKCGGLGRVDMSNIRFLFDIRAKRFHPNQDEQNALRCRHDAEAAYVDTEIGRLVRSMDEAGLSKDAWLVITADHGEELFEHGGFEHGHRYEDEMTKVPLIIRAPDRKWKGGTRVSASARHLDLTPTVLDWLGRPKPAELEGRSLMPLVAGAEREHRPAYMSFNLTGESAHAFYDGRYKIIESLDRKHTFMYDDDADPNEQHKLGPEHPVFKELQTKLRSIHDGYEKQVKHNNLKENQPTLSNDQIESLRSLGYIE